MAKRILMGQELLILICKAIGMDESRVRRVIIDVTINEPVMVYVQQFGDERLLKLDWPGQLDDAVINREGKEPDA